MEKFKKFAVKHRFLLICCGILAVRLAFCLRVAPRQSLSLDEISELGFIARSQSLGDILHTFLTVEVTNLPLFALLAALWYRLVPWGEGWLLLLCELLTTAGCLVLCQAAKRMRSEWCGYFCAVLLACSSTLILRCDMEYRCYSFLFLTLSATLYCQIGRIQAGTRRTPLQELSYAAALTLLAYSHYFGCLAIVALVLADLPLLWQKRLRPWQLFPYFVSGILLLPWFIAMLLHKEKSLLDFWPTPPVFGRIPEAMRFALSNDEPLFVLLLLGMIGLLMQALVRHVRGSFDAGRDWPPLVLIWLVLFILGAATCTAPISTSTAGSGS